MSEAFILLKEVFYSQHDSPDKEWDAFSSIWKPFSAKRKQILTQQGEKEKYLYFVAAGVQRIYFSDSSGKEATLIFTYAPSFGGVLDSFLLQHPSRYTFETLSVSSFLRASYAGFQKITHENPGIELMIRNGITVALSGVLERLAEIQCFSSEEKFKSLLKRSPHILQLVPHKYLASYLGIDVTNFSKLMNTIKI